MKKILVKTFEQLQEICGDSEPHNFIVVDSKNVEKIIARYTIVYMPFITRGWYVTYCIDDSEDFFSDRKMKEKNEISDAINNSILYYTEQ
jgi:hypothetical protein